MNEEERLAAIQHWEQLIWLSTKMDNLRAIILEMCGLLALCANEFAMSEMERQIIIQILEHLKTVVFPLP
jgi:hypothetical protein